MRVWTDGSRARVWHSRGCFRITDEGRVTWENKAPAAALVAPSPSGPDLLESAPPIEHGERVAAVAIDDERLADVRVSTGKGIRGRLLEPAPMLHIARVGGDADRAIPLGGDPPPVDWPEGLIWKTMKPARWSQRRIFGGCCTEVDGCELWRFRPKDVTLTLSPFGLGVGAGGTGHVGLLRDDGSLNVLARVPTAIPERESPTSVSALPLEVGMVVVVATLGARRRRGALLHLDDEGGVRGHWPPEGGTSCGSGTPSIALVGRRLLVAHGRRLSLLALPTFEEIAHTDLEDEIGDLAHRNGAFACVGRDAVHLGTVDEDTLVLNRSLGIDALLREDASMTPKKEWEPEREDGPTNVEAAVQKADPWKASAGETFALHIRLRSIGKAGKALRIIASGPAIENGHLELTRAEAAGDEATFETEGPTFRAKLEQVEIPQGYKRPVVPKPKNEDQKLRAKALLEASRLDLVIEGRALAAGRPLLKLQIGGLEGDAFRWTRPFLVE